ncbi:MAG: hypothetical protein M3Y50_15190 [Acidobacteriota bacterium]|nr:hypothetical protein [Acidobacteriota bacterium]
MKTSKTRRSGTDPAPLVALQQALTGAVTSKGLTITASMAAAEVLLRDWVSILALPSCDLALAAPVNIGALDGSGWFTVKGTAAVLGWPAAPLEIVFFASESHDTSGDGQEPTPEWEVQSYLDLGAFPQGWTFGTAFASLPAYTDYSGAKPQLQPTFVGALGLADGRGVYSSYSFVDANELNAEMGPGFCVDTCPLPASATAHLGAGLHLQGAIETVGPGFGELAKLTKLPKSLPVTGLVSRAQESDASMIALTHDFRADPGGPPVVSLPGSFSQISLGITGLTFTTGLDDDANIDPSVDLALTAKISTVTLDVNLNLPVGHGQGSLTGSFDPPADLTTCYEAWLTALGLQSFLDLLKDIPDSLDPADGLELKSFHAEFSVSPANLTSLSVGIATAFPWVLIPDLVTVQPTFLFGTDGGGGAQRYLEVDADWYLGTTVLQTSIRTDTKDVSVILPAGEVLTTQAVFQDLFGLSSKHIPELELIEFELTGNYGEDNLAFSIEAESGSPWKIDLLNKITIGITDVEISALYTPEDGFTATLRAALQLGGTIADVGLTLGSGDSLSVDVLFPKLYLGDLVDDVLHGMGLPDEYFSDVVIDELAVHIEPANKLFTMDKTPSSKDAAIKLWDGFSFTLSELHVRREPKEISAAVELQLQLDDHSISFDATYESGVGSTFLASYSDPIHLSALIQSLEGMLGPEFEYPLPVGDLTFTNLEAGVALGEQTAFAIAFDLKGGAGASEEYGSFQFLGEKQDKKWRYVLFAELNLNLDLASLPVVGRDLQNFGADVSVKNPVLTMASEAFSAEQISQLASLCRTIPPTMPTGDVLKGVKLQAQFTAGTTTQALTIELGGSSSGRRTNVSDARSENTKWFDVNRTAGAVTLNRIGLRYGNGELLLMLDAGMVLGPVGLTLDGLGIGSHLDDLSLVATLDGLGVSMTSGALAISGGLVRTQVAGVTTYVGTLRLTTAEISLALLGQYSDGTFKSLFVFVLLDAPPLGGPPFLFVEGLSLAVGYNNRLTLPSIDEVPTFPLVAAVFPSHTLQPGSPLDTVMTSLEPALSLEKGEFWLAAGVRFTSFNLVESFALLSAEFGNTLEFALLGISEISLPPDTDGDPATSADPIAFAQVAIKATFDPSTGALSVLGQLTNNSYVLSRNCQLTGGFAFCFWTKDVSGAVPVSAGDFVYSVGGYHPQYVPPPQYPAVPRLGMDWQVDSNLSLTGTSYFALTPACIMAGGGISAVWSSGDLSAWFESSADFLMYWKPFRYKADFSCSIGVSYRLNLLLTTVTVTVSIDVDVTLQGPSFGGSAHIDLRVVSFTIDFGDQLEPPKGMDWSDFRKSFLPSVPFTSARLEDDNSQGILKVFPTGGLLRDLTTSATGTDPCWVFHPENMVLSLSSAVPAKSIVVNGDASLFPVLAGDWSSTVGVGPMGLDAAGFTSAMTVKLEQLDEGTYVPYNDVQAEPVKRALPSSMWVKPDSDLPQTPNEGGLVQDVLCGLVFSRNEVPPAQTREVPIQALLFDPVTIPLLWQEPLAPTTDSFHAQVEPDGSLEFEWEGKPLVSRHHTLQAMADAAPQRNRTVAAMRAHSMVVELEIDLHRFTTDTVLDDWPRISKLGEM